MEQENTSVNYFAIKFYQHLLLSSDEELLSYIENNINYFLKDTFFNDLKIAVTYTPVGQNQKEIILLIIDAYKNVTTDLNPEVLEYEKEIRMSEYIDIPSGTTQGEKKFYDNERIKRKMSNAEYLNFNDPKRLVSRRNLQKNVLTSIYFDYPVLMLLIHDGPVLNKTYIEDVIQQMDEMGKPTRLVYSLSALMYEFPNLIEIPNFMSNIKQIMEYSSVNPKLKFIAEILIEEIEDAEEVIVRTGKER